MLMPEACHSKHDGYVANHLRTGKKKTIGIGREFVGQRKNGTTFPMALTVGEVQLGDKRLFTGIVRDINEHKRVKEALRESEEKYRTLSSNIPGMIYRGRPDWSTEIITNSEMVCGYSVDEFNTQKVNWLDLIHPDDKQRVFEEGSKLLEKPMFIAQEYRILAKDGSTRWVSDHKISFFKDDGLLIGVDGIVYDVTDRKLAEEKLREIEAKNQSILNAIPDLMFSISKDGI
nr:PAS domain S-box protein [bacterium]